MYRSKLYCLLVLMLLQASGFAQQFSRESRLAAVPADGFYRIPLSAEWGAYLNTDLSNVRLLDEKNRSVPFVVSQDEIHPGSAVTVFPMIAQRNDTTQTIIEIDARSKPETDHLYLLTGNHAVERRASLSGSNDGKQWFIINDRLWLTNEGTEKTGRFVQLVRFPLVQYSFYKLLIKNEGSDPLPVLQTGAYVSRVSKPAVPLLVHSGTEVVQKDSSDGNSYITIKNKYPYPVHQLQFRVDGAVYFKRPADLFALQPNGSKQLVHQTVLISGKPALLELSGVKATQLQLVVHNGDNPPLTIDSVATSGRQQALIAHLQKGTDYRIAAGSESLSFPDYDLAHFRDSIPQQLPLLLHGNITAYETAASAKRFNWLWPSILLMLVLLGTLTFKLANDVKRRENSA